MTNEIAVIEKNSEDIFSQAKTLVVKTNEDYNTGSELIKSIKCLEKEVRASYDPIISKAHAAHKEAVAQRDKHLDPLKQACDFVSGQMSAYYSEQRRREREARMTAMEEAKKKQEDQILAKAEHLNKMGQTQAAERVLSTQPIIQVQRTISIAPKIDGISHPELWSAEVFDLPALALYAVQNDQVLNYLLANEKALNQMARALKGSMNIPGVRIISTLSMTTRTK